MCALGSRPYRLPTHPGEPCEDPPQDEHGPYIAAFSKVDVRWSEQNEIAMFAESEQRLSADLSDEAELRASVRHEREAAATADS